MDNVFRTLVVPATLVDLARGLGAGLSTGGEGMFTVGLSADGSLPATHFVSTGYIGSRFAEYITSAELLHAACTEAGASVTLEQCTALVTESDVSEEPPFDVFTRLGLTLTSEEQV